MIKNNRPLVLVIAGLDSGGGAGITADTLTIHDCGAWALPCVSALTAQSLKNVTSISDTPVEQFKETLKLAKEDWEKISSAKIGLVTHKDILEETLLFFEKNEQKIPVVWDPVLTATAGRLESADLKTSLKRILKICTVFTPNLPEALELADWTSEELEHKGIKQLGEFFIDNGAQAVIIKGGHRKTADKAIDTFVSKDLSFTMTTTKTPGDGAHGGGCAFSSALASFIASGYSTFDAAVLAKAYVYRGIVYPGLPFNRERPPVGHNGMPDNMRDMPIIQEPGFPEQSLEFPKCPKKLGLYPVVDSFKWVQRLLKAGVKTLQLRIKDKSRPDLYSQIEKSVNLAKQYDALLFIDDHYELAIKAGAYGVHLGMEDLKTADLNKIRQSGLRLGISTHGPYEMLKAFQLKPSYIALGHIFPTKSKIMPSKPQGPEKLLVQSAMLQKEDISTVAIGGIKLDNAESVISTGVGSIALITGITKDENPEKAVQKWTALFEKTKSEQQ
jgi:hydroxymethylpyrimidine kinase/phosphomethylpyrimidine kinase/thiamine-phosphate diphosphorylase